MFIIILLLGIIILMVIANGFLLSKAGEKGAKILIPFYGGYLLYKAADAVGLYVANLIVIVISYIATMAGASTLTGLLSIASLLISIFYSIKLAKAYGKGGGFAVGLIFLPVVFLPILAFGDSEHVDYSTRTKVIQAVTETWTCPTCGHKNKVSRGACSECGDKRP